MYQFKKERKALQRKAAFKNNGKTLADNRSTAGNNLVQRKVVAQLSGGGHYWRKQRGGKWIYCGKYGSHAAANAARKANGWNNGNGWQFSQGGKKNPPGT